MDWLTFASSIVSAIAWPSALVVIALYFRTTINKIAGRLIKAKGFGGELELAKELDDAEQLMGVTQKEKLLSPENNLVSDGSAAPVSRNDNLNDPELKRKIAGPPPYVILQTWKNITGTMAEKLKKADIPNPNFFSTREIEKFAKILGLEASEILLLNRLRQIRNQAAHQPDEIFSETDALRYQDLANPLISKILALK